MRHWIFLFLWSEEGFMWLWLLQLAHFASVRVWTWPFLAGHGQLAFKILQTFLKINASSMWDFSWNRQKVCLVCPSCHLPPPKKNFACFKWAKLKSGYFCIFDSDMYIFGIVSSSPSILHIKIGEIILKSCENFCQLQYPDISKLSCRACHYYAVKLVKLVNKLVKIWCKLA